MFITLFVQRPRQFITKLISPIRRQLHHLSARRALRRAVRLAYQPFAKQHEQWVANFFDEHFLVVHAAPLLLETWEKGRCLTPARLAAMWRAQFSPTNMIADMLASEATQVAADFLVMLDAELDTVPLKKWEVPCCRRR